jgi:CheY-like chemotaxis protein
MLEEVKAGQVQMPALVLLDLNMPGMNGLDVLATVRNDTYFNEMPIFCVLTSSRDPRDAERAKQLHVSGFFTKASSMEEYISFFDALVA